MRLLIHDLNKEEFDKIFPKLGDETKVISHDSPIRHCIGCFGCWVKTPGACVIRDEYGDMGENLSKCSEVIIVSKCCYGGFSPFVKNVLDRSIPYVHPYFATRNGETHHVRRYDNEITMKVWFYGEQLTENEQKTAEKLVNANCVNLSCHLNKLMFSNSIMEMEGQTI